MDIEELQSLANSINWQQVGTASIGLLGLILLYQAIRAKAIWYIIGYASLIYFCVILVPEFFRRAMPADALTGYEHPISDHLPEKMRTFLNTPLDLLEAYLDETNGLEKVEKAFDVLTSNEPDPLQPEVIEPQKDPFAGVVDTGEDPFAPAPTTGEERFGQMDDQDGLQELGMPQRTIHTELIGKQISIRTGMDVALTGRLQDIDENTAYLSLENDQIIVGYNREQLSQQSVRKLWGQ